MVSESSAAERLRLFRQDDRLFFVSKFDDDEEFAPWLTFLDQFVRGINPALSGAVDPRASIHVAVVGFMSRVEQIASDAGVGAQVARSAEGRHLILKCQEYFRYFEAKCAEQGLGQPQHWINGIAAQPPSPGTWRIARLIGARGREREAERVLLAIVQETIEHLFSDVRSIDPYFGAHFATDAGTSDKAPGLPSMDACVPQSVVDIRTEACLPVIRPWFHRSLPVAGDIAEFGCFRGGLSVKFAFYVRALGLEKTAYAFDTFQGFTVDDPDGDTVIGTYSDNDDAYGELRKWAKVLPLVPVKGDARETCKTLTEPLSFVWLDLDIGTLLDPVLDHVRTLCAPETVIGLDDYGRRETRSVKPWADEAERAGRWTKLQEYPDQCIAFYRAM